MMEETQLPCQFELVLTNGVVVDPGQGIYERAEVAFSGGRVAAVGQGLAAKGSRAVDVGGRVITPGLIDLHTHLYHGVSALGVEIDSTCLPTGVTTAVDAGTAGAITFPGFRDYCIAPARTRVYSFVNVSSIGLIVDDEHELGRGRYLNFEALEDTLLANPDICLGIKVRVSRKVLGDLTLEPLLRALEVAERTRTRVMVHLTRSKPPIADVFDALRPGDIATHVLHGREHPIVENGHVVRAVFNAQERGVRTDVGHGQGSFSVETARVALADGFRPDTISTDLHAFCINGPCFDLPTTMSKFLSLGLSLNDVVAATTSNAARSIGKEADLGALRRDMIGDAAVFGLAEGDFIFEDCLGVVWTGHQRLVPFLTVLGGDIVWKAEENLE